MNTFLCGPPMSGKTTLGRWMAERWPSPFIDTDQLVESAYRAETGTFLSCRQIFAKEGERFFRELEKQHILSLRGIEGYLVALGGGSIVDPEIREWMRSFGRVIYLKTSPDILWERMEGSLLPSYLDPSNPRGSFDEMMRKRAPLYEEVAQRIVETDRWPQGEEGVEWERQLLALRHGQ